MKGELLDKATKAQRAMRLARYNDQIKLALIYKTIDPGRVEEVLNGLKPAKEGEEDLRGFEWYHLMHSMRQDVRRLADPGTPVRELAALPDGKALVALLSDGIGLFRPSNIPGKPGTWERAKVSGSAYLAVATRKPFIAVLADNQVHVFDASNGLRLVRTFAVTFPADAPNGRRIIPPLLIDPKAEWVAIYDRGFISAYSIQNPTNMSRHTLPAFQGGESPQQFVLTSSRELVALTQDRRQLLFLELGGEKVEVKRRQSLKFTESNTPITDVRLSPTGRHVVLLSTPGGSTSAEGRVELLSLSQLGGQQERLKLMDWARDASISGGSFTPDGRFFALLTTRGQDNWVATWYETEGKLEPLLRPTILPNQTWARSTWTPLTPFGSLSAAWYEWNTAEKVIWGLFPPTDDLAEYTLPSRVRGATEVFSFSPFGNKLLIQEALKTITPVRVFNNRTSEVVSELSDQDRIYTPVLGDDSLLAGEVASAEPLKPLFRVWKPTNSGYKPILTPCLTAAYSRSHLILSFVPKKSWVIVADDSPKKAAVLQLWDVEKDAILAPQFACSEETSSFVWAVSDRLAFATDKAVYTWRLSDAQLLDRREASGVRLLAFAEDGQHLSALGTKELIVWNFQSHEVRCHRELPPRLAQDRLAVHPSGRRIASARFGRAVTIWNVGPWDDADAQLQELCTLNVGEPVTQLVFSPDGESLAAVLQSGTVRVWRAPKNDPR